MKKFIKKIPKLKIILIKVLYLIWKMQSKINLMINIFLQKILYPIYYKNKKVLKNLVI